MRFTLKSHQIWAQIKKNNYITNIGSNLKTQLFFKAANDDHYGGAKGGLQKKTLVVEEEL